MKSETPIKKATANPQHLDSKQKGIQFYREHLCACASSPLKCKKREICHKQLDKSSTSFSCENTQTGFTEWLIPRQRQINTLHTNELLIHNGYLKRLNYLPVVDLLFSPSVA